MTESARSPLPLPGLLGSFGLPRRKIAIRPEKEVPPPAVGGEDGCGHTDWKNMFAAEDAYTGRVTLAMSRQQRAASRMGSRVLKLTVICNV